MGVDNERADGRLERGRQTQEKIVDAILALIEAGDPAPTNARIAARAGISTRLVYHHFEDLEDLLGVAVERRVQQVTAHHPELPATGALATRIAAVVAQRADVLEWVTPVRLAAMRMEPYSERLRAGRDAMFAKAREQLATVFAHEIDALPLEHRDVLVAALDVTTSWAAWHHLRLTLDANQAAAVVAAALTALVTPRSPA